MLLLTLESCRPDQLDKLLAIAGKAGVAALGGPGGGATTIAALAKVPG